jgi:FKBP-type peptidyl-prolyl cis-trans isomerase 2
MQYRTLYVAGTLTVGVLLGGTALAESLPSAPLASTPGNGQSVEEGKQVTVQYFIAVPGDPKAAYRDVTQFVQGKHEILPAFEKQIAGMREGEEKQFQLAPDEGFGPYDERQKQSVQKDLLPPEVKPGDVVGDKDGHAATVLQVSPSAAVLDYNHPLAGKPLIVSLKVLKVETPSS